MKGSGSAYAKHRGISQPAVSKAIKEGRLKTSVEKVGKRWVIDFEAADIELGGNALPVATVTGTPRVDKTPEPDSDDVQNYQLYRVRTEKFKSATAELDYLKKAGELVEIDTLRKSLFGVARMARDRLMALPPRLAATALAANSEPEAIHAIQGEIHQVLNELADVLRSDYGTA